MLIVKAHYSLHTSGVCFHEQLYDKADPDLWMRDAGHCYEYVSVYVDDIMAMIVDPENFFKELEDIYGYKLKGVRLPSYHLGGNFYCDLQIRTSL